MAGHSVVSNVPAVGDPTAGTAPSRDVPAGRTATRAATTKQTYPVKDLGSGTSTCCRL